MYIGPEVALLVCTCWYSGRHSGEAGGVIFGLLCYSELLWQPCCFDNWSFHFVQILNAFCPPHSSLLPIKNSGLCSKCMQFSLKYLKLFWSYFKCCIGWWTYLCTRFQFLRFDKIYIVRDSRIFSLSKSYTFQIHHLCLISDCLMATVWMLWYGRDRWCRNYDSPLNIGDLCVYECLTFTCCLPSVHVRV